jgi:4a-hydroxytetrahydrobiopterin dehydratase
METYTPETVRDWLESYLPAWRLEEGRLVREYRTGGWQRGQLLAGLVGFLAEATNHHPDLEIGYPRVVVRLSSHDAGGITARDLELARLIEENATWRPAEDSVFDGPQGAWFE